MCDYYQNYINISFINKQNFVYHISLNNLWNWNNFLDCIADSERIYVVIMKILCNSQ